MKRIILVLICSTTFSCAASQKYNQAVKSCLSAQIELGNKYLPMEEGSNIVVLVKKFEDKLSYILSLKKPTSPVSNAGPISVCHMNQENVEMAFFEYGEFGSYAKNRRLFVDTPSITINDVEAESYEINCIVGKNLSTELKCSSK